ncbi:hypothetical protein [Paenibacillus barengoltzii]|uniref:Uncharacterized protein n=1 Tax=Paenibacillus barengoltzii G22 TaxID=1235795 RepID=R9L6Z6_9BACL|nr:hypothetical protein [Paenibacillus barengoltzii]EOS54313.1 hypothetical protein C812_03553 [Paenibacillus barengoltzii G22]
MHRRQWLAAYEKLVLLSDEYSRRIATCKEIIEVVIGGVYRSQVNWHQETLSEIIAAILDIQYSLELKLRLIEAEKAFLARLIDRNSDNH